MRNGGGCRGSRFCQRAKPFCHQGGGIGIASFKISAVENNDDNPLMIARGGHGYRETGLSDVTRFESVTAIDVTEQVIMCAHDDRLGSGVGSKCAFTSGSITQGIGVLENKVKIAAPAAKAAVK